MSDPECPEERRELGDDDDDDDGDDYDGDDGSRVFQKREPGQVKNIFGEVHLDNISCNLSLFASSQAINNEKALLFA